MTISRVSTWLIFSIVVIALCLVRADDESTKEYVLTLDHSNLTEVVSKHDFIVVEFYAPWCGHCKSLAPEYEKAASMLSSNGIPIVLAKVNVDEEANKPLASEYEVQGFPTLKILRDGGKTVQEYKGPRDAEGIVAYLKKQTGPASAEIKSADEATELVGEKKIVIVGVFPKFSGEEFETFMSVAEKMRSDYEFGHTLDAKFLPRGSSVSGPVVRLFKPFDELSVDSKVFSVDALENFVQESSVPLVTVFDNDQANHPYLNKFFQSESDKAMLFLDFTSDLHDAFKVKYHEVAEQTKGNGIIFLIGDTAAGKNAFDYFGLSIEQAPLIIIQKKDGKKYLKSNVEPSQIEAWVKEYKDGNVVPFTKSEPIPETNDEPVKVVVADSLQDVVFNSGKNVLLEFYAPWCGHCKTLAPILEEIAVSYESDSDVMIAKLDGTANDVPSETFEVKGFPTMYFKTASGKVLEYDGDRTKEGIIDFIQKNRDTTTTAQQEEPVKEEEKDEL